MIAATALAACSNENENAGGNSGTNSSSSDEIVFSAGIATPKTRAYSGVADIAAFNVAAVKADNSVYFAYDAVAQPANPSSDSWASGKMWTDGTLNFYAYAPTSVSATVAAAATQTINFTQTETVANQIDLITAYNSGSRSTNPIALDFKHALSQIEIQAANGNTADYLVEASGAKLAFLPSTGTMTFQTTASGAHNPIWATVLYPTWNAQTTPVTFADNLLNSDHLETAVELNGTARKITTNNFYMLPQTLSGDASGTGTAVWPSEGRTQLTASNPAAYIAVKCKITRKDDNQVLYNGYSAVSLGSDDITWEPGKKYIYTINFFTAGGGGGQIDPINPVDPGAPIISGINFTVTVSDWVDGGSANLNMM